MITETEFLGLQIGTSGIRVGEDRKRIVKDWLKPATIAELRGFVGLLQFFCRFIHEFSDVATPLTNLTRSGRSMADWDAKCDSAYATLKQRLVCSPIIQAPDWSLPFRCHIDASQKAVGGTLTQVSKRGEHAISNFSKRLSPEEENYSAKDREQLGLIYFLKRFKCYLEVSSFDVLTDNQVLKSFFNKTNPSGCDERWLDFLSQFNITKMTLVKGKIHVLGTPYSGRHVSSQTISSCATSKTYLSKSLQE